jgi:hypothetical protein
MSERATASRARLCETRRPASLIAFCPDHHKGAFFEYVKYPRMCSKGTDETVVFSMKENGVIITRKPFLKRMAFQFVKACGD